MIKKAWNILSKAEQRGALKATAAVVMSTIVDIAGLATLLPAIYWILDRDGNSKAVFFCLVALILIFFKGLIGIMLAQRIDSYCMGVYRRLSLDIYMSYYNRGLDFISRVSATKLSYDVNTHCMTFSTGIMTSFLTIVGDCLLLGISVIAITIWSPLTSVVLIVSFLPAALIWNGYVRKRLSLLGQKESHERRRQWGRTVETFRGYCDIETTGSFDRYLHYFQKSLTSISSFHSDTHYLMSVPAVLSELCAVVGLTMMVTIGGNDAAIMVGVFALAAFRLLPALRQLMSGISRFRSAQHVIPVISDALKYNDFIYDASEPNRNKNLPIPSCDSITFSGLDFGYEGNNDIFSGFGLTIFKGDYIGIQGESGKGKTTLVQLVMGFRTPSAGHILIDGIPLWNIDIRSWRRRIGYVPQEVFLFDVSVLENITMSRNGLDEQWIRHIINTLGLEEIQHREIRLSSSDGGEDRVLTLSGGERQRVGIARALAGKPEILILDEATSSLDTETEKRVVDFISDLHLTHPEMIILSISHKKSTLGLCDRIIEI